MKTHSMRVAASLALFCGFALMGLPQTKTATPPPLQKLKGTWSVTCRISRLDIRGGTYSMTTRECPSNFVVKIVEREPGVLGDAYEGELYFLFSIKAGKSPNTYLLTFRITGIELFKDLPLTFTEAGGFQAAGTDKGPTVSITFAETGAHTWRVKVPDAGADVTITFERTKPPGT